MLDRVVFWGRVALCLCVACLSEWPSTLFLATLKWLVFISQRKRLPQSSRAARSRVHKTNGVAQGQPLAGGQAAAGLLSSVYPTDEAKTGLGVRSLRGVRTERKRWSGDRQCP